MNPGIIKLVKIINHLGYDTCDSGDGETHDFECDRNYPYVVIKLKNLNSFIEDVDNIKKCLEYHGVNFEPMNENNDVPCIQGNYDPCDKLAFIHIMNVTDKMLKWT